MSGNMRTYGDKPSAFQLEEGGDFYYIGSEVSVESAIEWLFFNPSY